MAENLEIPRAHERAHADAGSSERNSGFSTAPSERLRRPVVPGR